MESKNTNPSNNNPSGSSEETPELEHKVDLMMDPKLSDENASGTMQGAPAVPEIDIFQDSGVAEAVEPDVKDEETNKKPAGKSESLTEEASNDSKVDDSDSSAADPLVDDIVAHESDELLAARDAEISRAFTAQPAHESRLKSFFGGWWHNRIARYGTLLVIIACLIAAGVYPTSRYVLLNTSGVRVASSVTVLDSTNGMPLKNVDVTVQGKTVKSNDDGLARISGLKLGSTTLTISRRGFAPVKRTVILGLGSNPLNSVSLTAVGTQFTFNLSDYLSGKPVSNAQVADGDATAQTDEKGKAVLTIGANDSTSFQALVTASGYRTEKVAVTANAATVAVVMVNSTQTAFVSKQSGKYDVYKSDLDGKNRQLLLAATGREDERISLAQNAALGKAALVSRRDNMQNQDGYTLQTLAIIDVADGSTLTLEHSEQIQLIGWADGRLVYVKIKAGTSAGNPERYQLFSYDTQTTAKLLLASANYFSDIVMIKNSVYYAASNNFQGGQSQLVKINADNSNKQILQNGDVFNIYRSSYDNLYYSVNPGPSWYSFHVGDSSVSKLPGQPSAISNSKFYLDAPDGKHALWTDVRDGKGVLLLYDANTKKDTSLVTQSGLTYPLRWLDARTVMYRVVTPAESADYVLSLDGGQPKKVNDVTNTGGVGLWMYY